MAKLDLTVKELVRRLEQNEIVLPELQRQYVWDKARVRDLLDSLYRGYPSGSILLWETDQDVIIKDHDGSTKEKQGKIQLLLDGQQRLKSLEAVTTDKPIFVKGLKKPIDILFNLEHPEQLDLIMEVDEDSNEDDASEDEADASEDEIMERYSRMAFVASSNKRLADQPNWVSVTEVFQNSSNKDFLMDAGVTDMNNPLFDKWNARLNKLRAIQEYEYRVHVLEENSYEEIAEIFVRVNSRGIKLRSSDLALAQITVKWRNSLKIFESFTEECEEKGFDLELGIHLKSLVSFASGRSRFKVVSRLPQKQLQAGWEKSTEGMEYALRFLKDNAKIDSPALLSSPFIIICLAYYGHHKQYQFLPEESQKLRHWVLLANAKGRYSRGSTETFLDHDLQAIREGKGVEGLLQQLETQVGRLNVFPRDLEGKKHGSAYFKTMFLAFRERGATDWRDQLIISLGHSGSKHSIQAHHIFPQAVLERRGLQPAKINDICNLVFLSGRANKALGAKEPAAYLPEILERQGKAALETQCIPIDPSLWEVDAYENFLQARRQLVADRLNQFLGTTQTSTIS